MPRGDHASLNEKDIIRNASLVQGDDFQHHGLDTGAHVRYCAHVLGEQLRKRHCAFVAHTRVEKRPDRRIARLELGIRLGDRDAHCSVVAVVRLHKPSATADAVWINVAGCWCCDVRSVTVVTAAS